MADDVLKDTIEIKVGSDTFEFTIPSYLDEIKIGIKARDIARVVTDDFTASMEGLDGQTSFLITTAARFEILLKRSSVKWPWTNGAGGQPVCDFSKWPKDKVQDAVAAGALFAAELSTFRQGGTPNTDTASTETVAGQPDTPQEPIR